jgi:hypothetical protein
MIRKFIQNIEKIIGFSPIILSSNLHKYIDPSGDSVYLKGRLLFIDSSALDFALFVVESESQLLIDKYRFHYMDTDGRMLFRYDNAPHHPDIDSHPHHKHTPEKITSTSVVFISDILNEISAFILGTKDE